MEDTLGMDPLEKAVKKTVCNMENTVHNPEDDKCRKELQDYNG